MAIMARPGLIIGPVVPTSLILPRLLGIVVLDGGFLISWLLFGPVSAIL